MHQAPFASCDVVYILVMSLVLFIQSLHALPNLWTFSFACDNYYKHYNIILFCNSGSVYVYKKSRISVICFKLARMVHIVMYFPYS